MPHPKKGTATERLKIPKRAVGYFLREGGKYKKELCATTGAKISIQSKFLTAGQTYRVATIRGSSDQVSNAIGYLKECIRFCSKRSQRRRSRSPTRGKCLSAVGADIPATSRPRPTSGMESSAASESEFDEEQMEEAREMVRDVVTTELEAFGCPVDPSRSS